MPALLGIGLYGFAVVRYLEALPRAGARRCCSAMAAAFALLGRGDGRRRLRGATGTQTWWEWHVLMLVAFDAGGPPRRSKQWHEERFSDLYLDVTAAGSRESP